MSEPIAFLNGQYVPVGEARLSVADLGLVHGAAVTEMLRTFRHQIFRRSAHIARLYRSLQYVGFPMTVPPSELLHIVAKVVGRNTALVPATRELGVVTFVTAGQNVTYLGADVGDHVHQPTVCVHTFELPCELWADKCRHGQHLITPAARALPPDTLDPKVKSRSRLHWYLADQQARVADSRAAALLLDHAGNLTETSTGNVFVINNGVIHTPGERSTLQGISQSVVRELAGELGIEYRVGDLQLYDALNAAEMWTSSTPYCLMPVVRLNGRPIGDGKPGPLFRRIMDAWNKLVGVDIIGQLEAVAIERKAIKREDS